MLNRSVAKAARMLGVSGDGRKPIWIAAAVFGGVLWCAFPRSVPAATFDGSSRVVVSDPTDGLGWVQSAGALTVSCWFKLTVPSDFTLTEDMTILVNQASYTPATAYAYAIYLSATTGDVEFGARGIGGVESHKIIERPYLDRWYHIAVVRSGAVITVYLDGRRALSASTSVGDSSGGNAVSIGGWGGVKRLRGEVQEVAIYQAAMSQEFITQYMFEDLPAASLPELRGYYKLAYAESVDDRLKNYAQAPPQSTDPATADGNVLFEEVDEAGEQSLFDAQKNMGRDASVPLSGSFSWDQTVFSRPTAGVPFEFRVQYSSANAFNGSVFGDFNPFENSVLGSGWRHSFDIRIVPSNYFSPIGGTDVIGLLLSDGSLEVWEDLDYTGTYTTRHREYRGELRFPTLAVCEWITPGRLIYKFQSPFSGPLLMRGRLLQVRDLNGNAIDLTWDTVLGRITRVTDTGGGEWDFAYLPSGRLEKVSALGWAATFTYDAENRLATKTIAGPSQYQAVASTQWQFAYSTNAPIGLVERIVNPRGKDEVRVSYDKYGRMTSQTDALDRITAFQYNTPALRQLTTTRQFGASPDAEKDRAVVETFDRKLHLLSRQDPLGFIARYEYDDFGNVIRGTDARGIQTTMTYDERANVISSTDPFGETTRWEYAHVLNGGLPHNQPTKETRPATAEAPDGWENRYEYDGAGKLLFHRDGPVGGADFGTLAEHAYDGRGQVISSKDANGNETRFAYDATTGFPVSRTVAYGTTDAATWTTVSRTELGWPLEEKNPLNESTAFGYNINGQAVTTTDAIGRVFTKAYDENGNLTAESDGKGVNTSYAYNDADERVTKTDRLGNVWDFRYNEFGELKETEGPAALSDGVVQRDVVAREYDRNGRLVKEIDPYGKFVAYEYDAVGNQTAAVDKLGRRSERSYDALNRAVAERDPLGNVRRTSYDPAGRVLVLTSPNGFPSIHQYDGRSRLTKWADPEGFEWTYTYDGVGNIVDIEDALGGHYVMSYGPRNERLTERNQDGKEWDYTYDALGRLKTQDNPLGAGAGPGGGPVSRTLHYDAAGRLDYVEFNTGRINDFAYDANNNVTNLVRAESGLPATGLSLGYDAMDRLTGATDTFGQTVGYEYDALSRLTKKVYPGGKDLVQKYDRLGRLKKFSFPAVGGGTHVCTLTYDDAGRLTGRTYPNGVIQTNTFDSADRILSLSYIGTASPPIALTYAYDRNGNKVGGGEEGTLAWKDSLLADYDDTSRFKPDGKLIDRTDAAAAGGPRTFTYNYDAAGNMTLAETADESYALTYDEDNRTTSITWDCGLTEKAIVNRYDAIGRRVSRAVDGIETRYVLDLTGDMERVVCETDAVGASTASYVHGPDLCFRVGPEGNLTCYHADAMENVIRKTGVSGMTQEEVSYTPYGRKIEAIGSPVDDGDPYLFVGARGVIEELPNIYFMRARYFWTLPVAFLSADPVRSMKTSWTANLYTYVEGRPLFGTDPSGMYAVVYYLLAEKEAAGFGHAALLLSDKNTTTYWSKNGPKDGDDRREYGSYAEFREKGPDARYGDRQSILVNDEQAEAIREYAEEHYDEKYDLWKYNCNDFVYEAISAGDVELGEDILRPENQFNAIRKKVPIGRPETDSKAAVNVASKGGVQGQRFQIAGSHATTLNETQSQPPSSGGTSLQSLSPGQRRQLERAIKSLLKALKKYQNAQKASKKGK